MSSPEDEDDARCCFCGYEPLDPGGIYSEVLDCYACVDCEQIAARVLTTAAEVGQFKMGALVFDVKRRSAP